MPIYHSIGFTVHCKCITIYLGSPYMENIFLTPFQMYNFIAWLLFFNTLFLQNKIASCLCSLLCVTCFCIISLAVKGNSYRANKTLQNEWNWTKAERGKRREINGKTGRKIVRDSVINLSLYYHTHLFIDSIFSPYLSRSTDYDRD